MSDTAWARDRLDAARVARLATADAAAKPHVVPVTFAYFDDRIVTVVDGKPKSTRRLKRLANIAANPAVTLLADHYDDLDWAALWWVRIDGRARIVDAGAELDTGLGALRDKYAQYREAVSTDGPLIVIDVGDVRHWSAHERFATRALSTRRLRLTPLVAVDADVMFAVLADRRMHEFTGGEPLTLDRLRDRYRHLVLGRSPDGAERWCNWIVRRVADGAAVGAVQATVSDDEGSAEVAWQIGVPWQGGGLASEAAAAVVGWLDDQAVHAISACIHPNHIASARVASRVGLAATAERVDGEVVWRRPPRGPGRTSSPASRA